MPVIYHHHWLIVKYFIISFSLLLSCLPTSFVDGMGFVALLLSPIVFSLSLLPFQPLCCTLCPTSPPLLVYCYFYGWAAIGSLPCLPTGFVDEMGFIALVTHPTTLFPLSPNLSHLPLHCLLHPPGITVIHHHWLIVVSLIAGGTRAIILSSSLLGFVALASPPPSSPSPFTSHACPSIACCVLPGHHCQLIVIIFKGWRSKHHDFYCHPFDCLQPKRLHSQCMPRHALPCVPRHVNIGVIQRCTPMDAFQAFATQVFTFAMRAKDACQGMVCVTGALCIFTTQVSWRHASDFVTHWHTPLYLCCWLHHNMIHNSQLLLLGGGLEYRCVKDCMPCYFLIIRAQFLSRGNIQNKLLCPDHHLDVPEV